MWLKPAPPGSPSMLPRWQPKQLVLWVYVSSALFAILLVPTALLPLGGIPNGVHVAPVMKYLFRTSLPGTCVVLCEEINSVFEVAAVPAIPHGFTRSVSLGLTVPGTGGVQFPGGWKALMLLLAVSHVMCSQLNWPVALVLENSHMPAVLCGTVFNPVVELYLYSAAGVLPKCSNVAQIISGWPFVLPTTWMLTSASVTFFVPFATHCAALLVSYEGTVAFMVM